MCVINMDHPSPLFCCQHSGVGWKGRLHLGASTLLGLASSSARAMETIVAVGLGFGGLGVTGSVGGSLSGTDLVADIVC